MNLCVSYLGLVINRYKFSSGMALFLVASFLHAAPQMQTEVQSQSVVPLNHLVQSQQGCGNDIPRIQSFTTGISARRGSCVSIHDENVGFISYIAKSKAGGSDITRVEISHQGVYQGVRTERLIHVWPDDSELGPGVLSDTVVEQEIKDPGPIDYKNRYGYYQIRVFNSCGRQKFHRVGYTHHIEPKFDVNRTITELKGSNNSYRYELEVREAENVNQIKIEWGDVIFDRGGVTSHSQLSESNYVIKPLGRFIKRWEDRTTGKFTFTLQGQKKIEGHDPYQRRCKLSRSVNIFGGSIKPAFLAPPTFGCEPYFRKIRAKIERVDPDENCIRKLGADRH